VLPGPFSIFRKGPGNEAKCNEYNERGPLYLKPCFTMCPTKTQNSWHLSLSHTHTHVHTHTHTHKLTVCEAIKEKVEELAFDLRDHQSRRSVSATNAE